MTIVEISNSNIRALFEPRWGGVLRTLQFNHPERGWVDVFISDSEPPKDLDGLPFFGCPYMTPFVSRLAEGLLVCGDDVFQFPVNWPSEGCAIHGTGWSEEWVVRERTATSLRQSFKWSSKDDRYKFETTLSARLDVNALRLEMALTNLSETALPMGFGYHPWFAGIETSGVALKRAIRPVAGAPRVGFEDETSLLPAQFDIATYDGLDCSFDGWDGEVDINLMARGTRVHMAAEGAPRYLHIYINSEIGRFCLEPVSNAPGQLGDEPTIVGPGQTMRGAMTLALSALD